MTTGGFLDSDDLHRLTGAARANGQEAWLKAEGVPHRREGRNLIVLWVHVQAWVERRPLVSFVEPDFSSLER